MSQYIYLGHIDDQWQQIQPNQLQLFRQTRVLRRDIREKQQLDGTTMVNNFLNRLIACQTREGSPLRQEYCPTKLSSRFVQMDGIWQWVEKDWSNEPTVDMLACVDYGDSGSLSDSEDFWEMSTRKRIRIDDLLGPDSGAETSCSSQQPRKKEVRFGETKVHDILPWPQEGESWVGFGEVVVLDEEDYDGVRLAARYRQLPTIESRKETRLRRTLLTQRCHGASCLGCQGYDGVATSKSKKVSFGSTTVCEIPEEFVTRVERPPERDMDRSVTREQIDKPISGRLRGGGGGSAGPQSYLPWRRQRDGSPLIATKSVRLEDGPAAPLRFLPGKVQWEGGPLGVIESGQGMDGAGEDGLVFWGPPEEQAVARYLLNTYYEAQNLVGTEFKRGHARWWCTRRLPVYSSIAAVYARWRRREVSEAEDPLKPGLYDDEERRIDVFDLDYAQWGLCESE